MADDVTTINGIGPERARVLAERLDVRTVEDLARSNADDIVAALDRVSHRTATLWIATAERRVAVRSDGWEIEAMFLVYVERRGDERRTAAHLVGTDVEERWPGGVTSALADWMDEHLPGTSPADAADDHEGAQPDAEGSVERSPDTDAADAPEESVDQPPAVPEGADSADAEDPLATSLRLFHPPSATQPQVPRGDGNFHGVIEALRAFALEVVARPDVAPSDLRVRARRVGAPSPTWEELTSVEPSAGEPTDVVRFDTPGLRAGLYRLIVSDESADVTQPGPLIIVE